TVRVSLCSNPFSDAAAHLTMRKIACARTSASQRWLKKVRATLQELAWLPHPADSRLESSVSPSGCLKSVVRETGLPQLRSSVQRASVAARRPTCRRPPRIEHSPKLSSLSHSARDGLSEKSHSRGSLDF